MDINVSTSGQYFKTPSLLPPDDLEFSDEGGGSRVVASRDLHPDKSWGPYPGVIQSDGSTDDQETGEVRALKAA